MLKKKTQATLMLALFISEMSITPPLQMNFKTISKTAGLSIESPFYATNIQDSPKDSHISSSLKKKAFNRR